MRQTEQDARRVFLSARATLPLPCLMLVTEPHPRLPEIVAAAVAGGVNLVQWRDRVTPLAVLHNMVQQMREAASPALLLANGPPAMISGDGWHLRSSVKFNGAIRMVAHTNLVGQSVHSAVEAIASAQSGADYLVAGSIYATQSHPNTPPQGTGFLQDVCWAVAVPVLAIGGVTPPRVAQCLAAGAAGVAVLSPIMRADDPQAIARAYRVALDAAWANRASPP